MMDRCIPKTGTFTRAGPTAVLPSPDEIDESYAGVLMRINGFGTARDLANAIAASSCLKSSCLGKVTIVELLARISGMSVEEFVCRHTTVPLRRGITPHHVSTNHGSEARRGILSMASRRQNLVGAVMCPGCVRAEQENLGRSYWHRELQIPGTIWCHRHRVPLLACKQEGAYFRSPSEFLSKGTSQQIECDEAFVNSPAYKTYIGLCAALMETTRPYDSKAVGIVLAARCRARKVRRSTKSRGWLNWVPTLSARARGLFPEQWLNSMVPSSKGAGQIAQLERAAWGTSHSHVTTYAIACAILYESADEAMDDIYLGVRELEALEGKSRGWDRSVVCTDTDKNRMRLQAFVQSN